MLANITPIIELLEGILRNYQQKEMNFQEGMLYRTV